MRKTAAADAPGRVNLMGEHTDYHDGYVLPTVIPQRTHADVQRRGDRRVRARSAELSTDWAEYELGHESRRREWLDYLQGVTAALAARGVHVDGFDVEIRSTVPVGAGVSSSAALEISVLRALRLLFELDLDDVALAKIGRAAETDFVGAPVGIMDQMAASIGVDGQALFLDTRTLASERIPFPPGMAIIVIDSGVAHTHAGGQYASRRRESFAAASLLGVERLRDLDTSALPRINQLPPILAARARHIVTENARVLEAVDALRAGDAPRLGALFAASHASMRDDYQTSTPEIDRLVEIGQAHADVFGARLTGGGFGGAVVMIARTGAARRAAVEICERYRQDTQMPGAVLVPQNEEPRTQNV
jgi:galactokinase